jgi:hypothetical protein
MVRSFARLIIRSFDHSLVYLVFTFPLYIALIQLDDVEYDYAFLCYPDRRNLFLPREPG